MFELALKAPELPLSVLHVFGPGGVGKTTLLREFAAKCKDAGIAFAHLDARSLEPTPDAFQRALAAAVTTHDDVRRSTGDECDSTMFENGPWPQVLESYERFVLFVDTYEMLTPLDTWLRESFLPDLPASVLVVLAGRQPPLTGWKIDPGWQSLARAVPLSNLSPDECRSFLRHRMVPDEEHDALLAFTHGHPLALSLVADVIENQGTPFRPSEAPDVIKTLIEHFVQRVPTAGHRRALEACALLRFTTESILEEILGTEDAHEIFEWLRRLSFVESGPLGLSPHDLARDALGADVRWRNKEWYADLHDRARAYYSRRLSETRGREQERVLSDYAYLHRDNPVIRPFLDWAGTSGAVPSTGVEEDREEMLGLIRGFENEESARIANYWLDRQPENILVFRNAEKHVVGMLFMIRIEQASADDKAADAAVKAACGYLAANAPLRKDERATIFRFWMAAKTYQAVSPTQSHIFLKMAQYYLTTADLAFSFLPVAEPDFWRAFCTYIDLFRVPGGDFEVGGRSFGMYGHDWRAVPPGAWLSVLADREMSPSLPDQQPGPSSAAEGLLVLDADSFAEAVKEALKTYPRPDKMTGLDLLKTRLVVERCEPGSDVAERVAALRALLDKAAETLEESPREAKYYRALHRTYLNPARSQEQAAEQLDIPFSTFRRYLKRGVDHVTQTLWQQEIGTDRSLSADA